jgi:hypothetical protein
LYYFLKYVYISYSFHGTNFALFMTLFQTFYFFLLFDSYLLYISLILLLIILRNFEKNILSPQSWQTVKIFTAPHHVTYTFPYFLSFILSTRNLCHSKNYKYTPFSFKFSIFRIFFLFHCIEVCIILLFSSFCCTLCNLLRLHVISYIIFYVISPALGTFDFISSKII